jgi:hypothetical protein
MRALEVLVEEVSAKAFLEAFLPRLVPDEVLVSIHAFNGKSDLLRKLPQRLRGYRRYAPIPKILILVDRDDDDCVLLKQALEKVARDVGFVTKSCASTEADAEVCNRIAVEELEAWILGDETAVRAAYPRVPAFAARAQLRNPDAVAGGTWEALERLLQRSGYYAAGLAKVECASRVAAHLTVESNRSTSFNAFVSGVRALISGVR